MLILTITLAVTLGNCTPEAKENANKKSGWVSDHMKRVVIEPRLDYESKVEKLGLMYHDEPSIDWGECEDEAYWNE